MNKTILYVTRKQPNYPGFELQLLSRGWACEVAPCRVSSTHSDNSLLSWVESDTSVWHWKSGRDHYRGLESRPLAPLPPPVNYWSSVTGAQCPRPVTVKDEGVLALSNEPSVEMPATNDPWAETHLSSARAMGAVGRLCVCVCVCTQAVCVYLTWPFKYPSPPLLRSIFPPFSSRQRGLGVARNIFLLPPDKNVIRHLCLV